MGECLELIFQRSSNHSSFVEALEETAKTYVVSDSENTVVPKSVITWMLIAVVILFQTWAKKTSALFPPFKARLENIAILKDE